MLPCDPQYLSRFTHLLCSILFLRGKSLFPQFGPEHCLPLPLFLWSVPRRRRLKLRDLTSKLWVIVKKALCHWKRSDVRDSQEEFGAEGEIVDLVICLDRICCGKGPYESCGAEDLTEELLVAVSRRLALYTCSNGWPIDVR